MYRQAQHYSYAGIPEELESGIITATGKGERGEGGGKGGMITTLFTRPARPHPVTRPATGEMGEGRGKAGGGDNDLVCQHDQSSAPQRVRRAEEGNDNVLVSRGHRDHGKGGDDNDLILRGQHDHIQSPAPQRAYKRLGWRLFHSLLEVVSCALSRGRGKGEGRAGCLQASDPSRLCTQREGGSGGRGRGGGGAWAGWAFTGI